MLKKIVTLFVLVPLGILLIVLCVTNRQSVSLAFNPFKPADQALSLTAPFFVWLFVALILGMVVGSFATWFSQGRYRKRARVEAKSAVHWKKEVDKKTRTDQVPVSEIPRLT
ncbi:lipopolysaccharide assembly protein LapA domain-containing protein [Rhizobium halophytocola]|uniref:Integral membrane protein n=1 Tax=Rhizobium halophytocola TaxID=735519 RepID=A0ABS4E018_9HYPH|nr:lipopolysaccharide assembly protein LapA domain-containing protein [Rhizobium halophytocola]MBP1851282.1 putative integral membrane protein [Rhizobium halophytocola]